MIENEFLFLGLLAEGPKHGYEIKRQIEKELIPAIGIQVKSIYYPLKKMEEAGLVEKEVGQQGRFPQRFIYCITPKGRKKFEGLIAKSFLSVERPYFQIDLSLYFLPLADQTLVLKSIKTRLVILKKIRKDLIVIRSKTFRTKPLELIFTHDLDLVGAEIASTEKLIASL